MSDEKSLRADVSLHGEGFKRVYLTLQRRVKGASVEETIGEVNSGLETFTWKPTLSNFDVVLVTYSNMYLSQFLDSLKYLSAETHQSFLMGSYMPNNFLLCDSLTMGYRLRLRGEKHIFGHVQDETRITLNG